MTSTATLRWTCGSDLSFGCGLWLTQWQFSIGNGRELHMIPHIGCKRVILRHNGERLSTKHSVYKSLPDIILYPLFGVSPTVLQFPCVPLNP